MYINLGDTITCLSKDPQSNQSEKAAMVTLFKNIVFMIPGA